MCHMCEFTHSTHGAERMKGVERLHTCSFHPFILGGRGTCIFLGGCEWCVFLSVGIMLVINHRVLCWNGLPLEMSPGSAAPSARYRSSAPLNVCGGLPLAHTPGAEPADRDIFNSAPPIPQLSGMLSNLHSVCSPLLYLKFRSIFAHQKHMLRRVKCTWSPRNEEHLGAHNLSSLLMAPGPCEYVYVLQ